MFTVISFNLLLSILAVEYFIQFPFSREGKKLFVVVQKSVRIVTSKSISDHWKERVLVNYLLKSIRATFFLIMMLLGLLVWTGFGVYAVDKFISPDPTVTETLTNPMSWIYMTLIASIYLYSRNHFIALSKSSDYSLIETLLHRLALGTPWIGRISLEIDCALVRNKDLRHEERHVFISGLARSGTTILMRTFYETGNFRSLTYRDMPFVLMPRFWKILSRSYHKDGGAEKERAHRDGIMVNFDSPEAFEEVFWKAFSSNDYLHTDHLSPHYADEEVIQFFQKFVRQVISSTEQPNIKRYLSKNNNNILRIESIRKAFPNALIIIPYREPIQHAISLFEQHKHFCELHEADSFVYKYMEWLGHHEFGMTHRLFQFGERWKVKSNKHHPGDINYWLALWINTYVYLSETSSNNAVFIRYEDLCSMPQQTIKKLFIKANIGTNNISNEIKIVLPKLKKNANIDIGLESKALQIYQNISNI